jgi:hypothetical protein
VEFSSALKFGLLERPSPGRVSLTDLAKKILRPHDPKDELDGLRQAVLKAPEISDVYRHYRGENLPDDQFFDNALVDNFKIPQPKLTEFKTIFLETLRKAQLIEEHNGKIRVLDISQAVAPAELKPIRADDDIFATGKIIDQVWTGIRAARVLVAELTSRNPNVFYELGLAHALKKPVVLVSSNEGDVPFDVRHIRVIYYDVNDPFWGQKLIAKVAENVLSALKNPAEATFTSTVE